MKKSNRNLTKSILFILVGLTIFFIVLVKGFVITKIICEFEGSPGKSIDCNNKDLLGKSLFFTNLDNSSEITVSNETDIEKLFIKSFQKKLPDTLIFTVSPRPPLYRFVEKDRAFFVETDGDIRQDSSGIEITTVYSQLDKVVSSDEFMVEEIHQLLSELIWALIEKKIQVKKIDYYDQNAVVVDLEKYRAIFHGDGSISNQVLALSEILNNVDVGSIDASIKEIDLRFDMPVMRTKLTNITDQLHVE